MSYMNKNKFSKPKIILILLLIIIYIISLVGNK